MSTIIKLFSIITILVLWIVLTNFAVRSLISVWKIQEVDALTTAKRVLSSLPNPFSFVLSTLKEDSGIRVNFTIMDGFTFRPRGGERIDEQFLQDRKQYRLYIHNPGSEPLHDVALRFQLPYPIESYELVQSDKVDEPQFNPLGLDQTVFVGGGGSVSTSRRPLTKAYQFKCTSILPAGFLELRVVLNSWRDPRGKVIPPGEEARYFEPEVGPEVTYVNGSFKYTAGADSVTKYYYAPFTLSHKKIVYLGDTTQPPNQISEIVGWE